MLYISICLDPNSASTMDKVLAPSERGSEVLVQGANYEMLSQQEIGIDMHD